MAATSTFDHTSPVFTGAAYWDAIDDLQRQGPLVRVESNGGYWAATGYEAVLRIAQEWESFTSTEGVSITRPSFEAMPRIIPIELDPPRQRTYRKQVNPHLTIKALTGLEESIRTVADEFIDSFIDRGRCDLAKEFALKLPGTVLFRLIFNSTDEDFALVEPASRELSFSSDPGQTARGAQLLREWAAGVFEQRAGAVEVGDIVDAVRHLNDTGDVFVDDELRTGIQILIQGGVGTSASGISTFMRILSERPELQARVRAEPDLIPSVIEECLRLEPPLPLIFRTARKDVEVAGTRIGAGEKVGLFFGAANRDPLVFDRPHDIVLDRPHLRHLAFGAGPHRCIGSNLARLQMRVALRQLVTRLGHFRIPEKAEVTYFSLQARGPSSLPLEFSRA